MLIVFHALSGRAYASAVIPYPQILPYVPPNTAQMYDILFNSYGVTAINENNDTKKLNAYVDLVTRVLGAGAESFIQEITNMVTQATQTRKITVSTSVAQSMLDILDSAITDGVRVENEGGGGIEFPPYEAFRDYTMQKWGMALGEENYQRFRQTWQATPALMCWINYSQPFNGGVACQVCLNRW